MTLDFIHIFEPGDETSPVLLLLHGTGGDERDLLDLGRAVAPKAALLSVRGKVLENGMPRFFKRLDEGVFDLDDLHKQTADLAAFLSKAREHYQFVKRPLYALGFSNGANIASSLLLSYPHALDGAALIRAMMPFEPEALPDLSKKDILLLTGLMDPIVPIEQPKHLADLFQQAGGRVNLIVKPAGHGLIQSDITDLQNWWAGLLSQFVTDQ